MGRRAGEPLRPLPTLGPPEPTSPSSPYVAAPCSANRAEGYRNLCRLITRMKLRAPKGEGALTLEDLDGHTARPRRARRPRRRSTAAATASAACSIALVGVFGRGNVYVELQRHLPPRRGSATTRRSSRSPSAFRVPVARDQRRPLRDAGGAAAVRRAHLHSPSHRSGAAGTPAGAQRRAVPEAAGRDGGAVRRSSRRASRATGELADRLQYTMADLGYRFPDYPVPPGETQASFLRQIDRRRRARALPAVSRPRARADRARARSHREARISPATS